MADGQANVSSLGTLGDAALRYARRGWKVFPVAPISEGSNKKNGKEPYPGTKGYKDATDDERQVQDWWTKRPDANIGLALAESGLVALDVDVYKDPEAWDLFHVGHEIPDTYRQSTAGGGLHLVFEAKVGVRYPGKVDGIPGEVKHNGYIVLAPSIALSTGNDDGPGVYECVCDAAPAPSPPWLSQRQSMKGTTQSAHPLAYNLRRSNPPDSRLIDLVNARENHLSNREDWLMVVHGMHHEYYGTHLEEEALAAVLDWSALWQGDGRETAHTDEMLRDDASYAWDMASGDRDDPVTGGSACMILRRMRLRERAKSAYHLLPHTYKDLQEHPPIPWLYGRHYLRGGLSLTVAPGGTGKSLLALDDALSIATGKSLLGEQTYGPKQVLYMNGGEDSREIVAARVDAAMSYHGITDTDLGGRLLIVSAPELAALIGVKDIKFAVDSKREGLVIDEGVINEFVRYLRENMIDVLILDPLKHFHLVPENDNDLINELAMVFVRIGQDAECAVEVVHHSTKEARNKPGASGIAQSRGAGALLDKARTARFLAPMTEKEAGDFGINDPDKYVRISSGKSNYGPKSGSGRWFSIEAVRMGNSTTEYPQGDTVGVLKTFKPVNGQDAGGMLALQFQATSALLDLPDGLKRSDRSPDWIGFKLADATDLDVGEGIPKTDRTNVQNANRTNIEGVVRGFEKKGILLAREAKQQNGNTAKVVDINREKATALKNKLVPNMAISTKIHSPPPSST